MSTLPCGCPEDIPDWDGRDVDLGGQPMLELKIGTFLHMPMGFDIYLGRVRHLVKELELEEQWPGFRLSQTGWFTGRILSPLLKGDSPSRHVIHIPSPFQMRGKLHKGDIGNIKKTVRDMQSELLDAGRMPKDLFLSYLTCPVCEEERGGTKIMIMRRWEASARLSKRIKNR